MKDLIKKLLRESAEGQLISVQNLKGLLKNVTNKTAIKTVNSWIKRGGNEDKVKLSPKEYQLLQDIKKGGPKPEMYSSKN